MKTRKTRKLVLASLLAAVGVAILAMGSFLRGTVLMASFLILFCLLEMGYRYAFSLYAVIAVLSLILLPHLKGTWMFLIFQGHFPIVKFGFEKLFGKVFSWIPKFLLFNAVFAILVFFLGGFFGISLRMENPAGWSPRIIYMIYFIVWDCVCVVFDVLCGKLAKIYVSKYKPRFSKHLK